MAREVNKLTPRSVASKGKPGYYGDGNGLYLQVAQSGAKTWIFRFKLNGRAREMGLGGIHDVPLAQAREKAAEARKRVRDGVDAIEARDAEKKRLALDLAHALPFRDCAAAYIAAHRAGWKNAKHVSQWENTLESYCGPVFGALPVSEVDTALVCKVLEPMWNGKAETAGRLRARIERVLDWATVRGYRTGDNPARWRGHLDKLLPAMKRKARIQHHPALPYEKLGAFMSELRKQEGIGARALEFTILTAARTNEALNATWEEIDLHKAVWTIPAVRMKAGNEHRVPLSPSAMALLKTLHKLRVNTYVFPSTHAGKPLSNMGMAMLLRRMKRREITVHGFRSTFRDWCAERTNYAREVAEMALAHTISDQVEAAYRRGDLFNKRALLMNEWAKFCGQTGDAARVIPLRRRSKA